MAKLNDASALSIMCRVLAGSSNVIIYEVSRPSCKRTLTHEAFLPVTYRDV